MQNLVDQSLVLPIADTSLRPYNIFMARGWESKSVEEQQAEARAPKKSSPPRLTPSQIQKRLRIESLTLSRTRVEQQLAVAQEPRHQEMLRRALADLDAQIQQVAETP